MVLPLFDSMVWDGSSLVRSFSLCLDLNPFVDGCICLTWASVGFYGCYSLIVIYRYWTVSLLLDGSLPSILFLIKFKALEFGLYVFFFFYLGPKVCLYGFNTFSLM